MRHLSIISVLASAALVATWFVRVRPWVVSPQTPTDLIEARWKKVVERADLAPSPVPVDKTLDRVLTTLDPHQAAIEKVLDGRRDFETLPPPVTEALADFGRWSPPDGEINARSCEPWLGPGRVSIVLVLGRLVTFTATADDPHLGPMIGLADALRRHGSLPEAVAGFHLADRAAEQLAIRPATDLARYAAYRPTMIQLLDAIARDAVCSYRLARNALADRAAAGGDSWTESVGLAPSADRELAMVRDFVGQRLERADAIASDTLELASLFRIGDPERLPKSGLVRALAVDAGDIIDRGAAIAAGWPGPK